MNRFETETCSRCGGSGKYSFNLMHGTMCYGCSGGGVKYTKRGLAAKTFYETLLSKPAEEIVEGDAVRFNTKKFYLVTFAKVGNTKEMAENSPLGGMYYDNDEPMVRIEMGNNVRVVKIGTQVRVMHTDEQKQEKLELALKYQDNLTKAGTVKKSKKNS